MRDCFEVCTKCLCCWFAFVVTCKSNIRAFMYQTTESDLSRRRRNDPAVHLPAPRRQRQQRPQPSPQKPLLCPPQDRCVIWTDESLHCRCEILFFRQSLCSDRPRKHWRLRPILCSDNQASHSVLINTFMWLLNFNYPFFISVKFVKNWTRSRKQAMTTSGVEKVHVHTFSSAALPKMIHNN